MHTSLCTLEHIDAYIVVYYAPRRGHNDVCIVVYYHGPMGPWAPWAHGPMGPMGPWAHAPPHTPVTQRVASLV